MVINSVFGKKKAKFSATGALPEKESKRLLEILIEIVDAGNLRGIIDRTYAHAQVTNAHEYIVSGHKRGNVVLRPIA